MSEGLLPLGALLEEAAARRKAGSDGGGRKAEAGSRVFCGQGGAGWRHALLPTRSSPSHPGALSDSTNRLASSDKDALRRFAKPAQKTARQRSVDSFHDLEPEDKLAFFTAHKLDLP